MVDLSGGIRTVLRRRVARRCGHPEHTFAPYQHKFGRWLDAGPEVREDDELAEVREAVGGYLAAAAEEGRRWGTAVGVAAGAVGAPVAFVIIWALS